MSFQLLREKSCFIGITLAGGFENAGGVGRVIGYILDEWKNSSDAPPIHIYDPRGKGTILLFPFFLALTLAAITWHKLTGKLALLHVNMSTHGSFLRKFFIIYWAKTLGIPVVIHLHGATFDDFYRERSEFVKKLIRDTYHRAARVIVLGKVWRDFMVDEVGVDPDKVVIIANGVPKPKNITKKKKPATECNILFLGRVGERKGVPELLKALASPEVLALEWQATIAGDGDFVQYAQESIKAGLGARVSFPGWVGREKVDELLAGADILVLPSHAENLPIAVLEGLAYSLAVITTPVGALPELLTDRKDTLIVPVGDAAKLTCALQELISNRELREELGKNAFSLFENEVDVKNTADSLAKLYIAVRGLHD